MLLRAHLGIALAEEIALLTDSAYLDYVGKNLSVTRLGEGMIGLKDLPCIIHGLSEEDLLATETWALVQELTVLLESYNKLGRTRIDALEVALETSLSDFQAARYQDVKSTLGPMADRGYLEVFDSVWPAIEEAMKSPRTSPIPIACLSRISYAKRLFETGRPRDGNAYLIAGLKEWAFAVSEPATSALILLGLGILLAIKARIARTEPPML